MDAIDIKLITLLQKDARMPLKQLAEQVFLSSPAVAARIERLEKEGIIKGYTAVLDMKKVGFPIISFINLDLSPTEKPTFYPFVCAHPNVLECYCVTGQHSIILKVATNSTEALDEFIGELQAFGATETKLTFSEPGEPRGICLDKIK